MTTRDGAHPLDLIDSLVLARIGSVIPAAANLENDATEARVMEPVDLCFTAGEPDGFDESDASVPYRGQERAKERLRLHIAALAPTGRFKALLTGPAGTGKTTLGRIIGHKIQTRRLLQGIEPGPYYELLPAQLEDKARLDAFMLQVSREPYAVVAIDEIHTLRHLESFFHLLHDSGELAFPLSNGRRLVMPSTISWLGMTTDPGQLDSTTGGAMRRRLEPEIRLDPPSLEDLQFILRDQGKNRGMTVDDAAIVAMAARAIYPWQARLIFREVSIVAAADRAGACIDEAHVATAFDLMQLDENGLLREDRDILKALFAAPYELATRPGVIRYRMSEEAVCAAAGVDRVTYKKRIQPKLLRQGFLTTVGGQSLTEKAVRVYAYLNEKAA